MTAFTVRVASISLAAFLLGSVGHVRADAVTDWNQTALRVTEIAGAPPPLQSRAMAIVHAAVFDAVNAVERKYSPYAVDTKAPAGTSAEAAAAGAAHGALSALYPQFRSFIDAALAVSLKKMPDGAPKSEGVKLGEDVATQVVATRKDDGAAMQVVYAFRTGPGAYQATLPMNAMPVLPHWGKVKPFILTSATQIALAGPPAIGDEAFAKDLNEVKLFGARNSKLRTPEQTAIAIHWAGSEIPPLNAVARSASVAKGLGLAENARLFALLNLGMADTLIAGFEAKYRVNFWRPVTAIRNAGLAQNSKIEPDMDWEPLLVTPPHPEYPSAHCLGAGAAVAILQNVFATDKIPSSYVYPPLGVMRRWDSFSQIAQEIGNARIWAGIHYRTAVEHGDELGRQIGDLALKTALRPVGN